MKGRVKLMNVRATCGGGTSAGSGNENSTFKSMIENVFVENSKPGYLKQLTKFLKSNTKLKGLIN